MLKDRPEDSMHLSSGSKQLKQSNTAALQCLSVTQDLSPTLSLQCLKTNKVSDIMGFTQGTWCEAAYQGVFVSSCAIPVALLLYSEAVLLSPQDLLPSETLQLTKQVKPLIHKPADTGDQELKKKMTGFPRCQGVICENVKQGQVYL